MASFRSLLMLVSAQNDEYGMKCGDVEVPERSISLYQTVNHDLAAILFRNRTGGAGMPTSPDRKKASADKKMAFYECDSFVLFSQHSEEGACSHGITLGEERSE
jgi:hypothetical protein